MGVCGSKRLGKKANNKIGDLIPEELENKEENAYGMSADKGKTGQNFGQNFHQMNGICVCSFQSENHWLTKAVS